jgi:hypothetical protein
MADKGDIELIITLDDGSIIKGLATAEKAAKKSGESVEKNLSSGFTKGFSGLKTQLLSLGAAFVGAFGARAAIQAAARQEDAVNSLNQALKSAGTFSQEASRSFQEFASQIQKTTKFGDEAVLEYAALARQFARTNDEAKQLTKAALDLSAATGVSVETAVRQLGGSLSGVSGQLGRIVPQTRELTAEQLKAGAALELVSQRFAGSAAAQVNTFSGALQQAKNLFGDLLETLGSLITRSPSIIAVIKFVGDQFTILGQKFKSLTEGQDPFRSILLAASDVARFFVSVFGPIIEGITGLVRALAERVGALAAVFVELFSGNFRTAAELFQESNKQFVDSIVETFSFSGTESALAFVDSFKTAIEDAPEKIKPPIDDINREIASIGTTANEVNGITFDGFVAAFNDSANKIKITAESLAQQLNNSLAQGASNAFAAFGGALVKGENAFKAFGKSILASLGQLLISFGTMLIAIGAGLSTVPFLFGLQGPAAIAAGAAAVVLGGALSALGGAGGGGVVPSTSGGVTSTGVAQQAPEVLEVPEVQQQQPSVNVTVQGNILDRRETGLELAEVIREAFDGNAVVFTT